MFWTVPHEITVFLGHKSYFFHSLADPVTYSQVKLMYQINKVLLHCLLLLKEKEALCLQRLITGFREIKVHLHFLCLLF